MKLFKLSMICLLFISVLSCGSDDNGDGGTDDNQPIGAQFVVDIDGERFEASIATAQMGNDGRFLSVSGGAGFGDPNGAVVGFGIGSIFPDSPIIEPGTYSSEEESNGIIYTPGGEESYETSGTQSLGQVVITAIDTDAKTISGTFEGTLRRSNPEGTVVLTNGEFNEVTYIEF